MPRGTPSAAVAVRRESALELRDRLTLYANPAYLIHLAERSRTYRDLIRRYSNDRMF